MNTVFAIKNQQGLYLSKQQGWVDGADAGSLFRTAHRDEAINTVFEVSSRDIYLRAEVIACELDAKGNPAVTATVVPQQESVEDIESEETEDSPPA